MGDGKWFGKKGGNKWPFYMPVRNKKREKVPGGRALIFFSNT